MDVSYAVDGVPLFHPLSYWWLEDDIPVGLDLQRRGMDMLVAGRDGGVGTPNESTEIVQIGLKMIVNAVDDRTVSDSYQALMGLLTKRSGYLQLSRTMFGTTTVTNAKLAAITDSKRIETGDSIRFTAVLTLPDVYFRDPLDSIWTQNVPVNNVVYQVSTLDNSTADIRDALIKLTGSIASPTLKDVGSGNTISVASVGAGRQVLIDVAQGNAYESASNSLWDHTNTGATWTDVTPGISISGIDSNRSIFCMAPVVYAGDPFNRHVSVFLATSSSSGSKLEIKSRRCFL